MYPALMTRNVRKFPLQQQESDDFPIAHVDRERAGRAEERRRQHEVDLHLPGGERREAVSRRQKRLGYHVEVSISARYSSVINFNVDLGQYQHNSINTEAYINKS